MKIKEYIEKEGDENFKLSRLQSGYVSDVIYNSARDTLSRACHDIFLRVKSANGKEGILLVTRQKEPMKGVLWPVGGGMRRGVPIKESLNHIVRRECNLEINGEVHLIDVARFFFRTNPYGSGEGVDDFGVTFYAVGEGQIKLDELHNHPIIASRENYENIKKGLHPYVKENIDIIFSKYWWEIL